MFEFKYKIKNNQLVKRIGEKPIPDDEPVFVFRAKDRKALGALMSYNAVLDTLEQKEAVTKAINAFREFQENNPEKMAEPTP